MGLRQPVPLILRMNPILPVTYRLRLQLVKLFDLLCRLPRWFTLERVLKRAAHETDDFFFVQIGANDGVIYDPVWPFVKRYQWRGIMVEPVPVYFERLKQNHSGSNTLIFENVAISARRETRDFYRVREDVEFLPLWCQGLGTFNLDVLLSHKWAVPDLENYVVTEKVECIPLSDLLEKHSVSRINLLLVDTEGYDFRVLEQVDFDALKPDILLYEHEYFCSDQRLQWENRLKQLGYRISTHLGNTLAYRPVTAC